MEGLEVSELLISEVKLDNLNIRLDSEYFKKEYLNFFKSVPNLSPLSTFVAEGYRVIYENTDVVSADVGVANDYPIFLQATDLATPFIKTDDFYYVHEKDWLRYPKGRIKAGELLIEVKGKIDKVSIVPNDFPKKALVTGSIYKLSVNEKINKHYLLTYLICKYGSAFKDRYKTNLLISFVSKDDLYRIPVPTFSIKFENQIELIFNKIFNFRKQSTSTYSQAESLLLETLGMTNFAPQSESINIKSFQDSFAKSKRLDAEHYQPKYDQLLEAFDATGFEIVNIDAIVFEMLNGAEVREYQDDGVPYLRIGDLKYLDIDSDSVVCIDPQSAEKGLNKIELLTGDVLLSRSGSLAVSAVVDSNWTHALISSHLIRLRIRDNRFDPYFFALFLSITPGKMQIQQWSNGGVQPEINQPALKGIYVPVVPKNTQLQIRKLILKAKELRNESTRLLEIAKRAVEIAIEKDEAAGMAYLKANSAAG